MKSTILIRVPESAGMLYERIQYPAGELQIRLTRGAIEQLFNAKALTVFCREAHKHLMELALLSDAIFHIRPFLESTLVLPYLPYSRADRRFMEGDCHGLKVFGEAVTRMHYHRVRTLDVHSFRAQAYFGHLQNVLPRAFIAKAVADITDHGGHPVVLLPDEGAKRYGLDGALQASKKRDPETGKLSGFEVPPELANKRDILIVDDICDGGGTFIGLAEAILDQELEIDFSVRPNLYLYVTHGIFSKGFTELSKYFGRIYTTDSVCSTVKGWYGTGVRTPSTNYTATGEAVKVKVFDCEPELLGEAE